MKVDELFNTKVYVNGKSEEIQRKLFKLGFHWDGSCDNPIYHLDSPFIYINSDKTLGNSYYMDSFSKHEYKEIKADDILSINTEELHPFDKVLVRDNDDEIWKCDLFSHIDKNEKYNKYICIGSRWEQCIPYQGNEHLVNTTDNIL